MKIEIIMRIVAIRVTVFIVNLQWYYYYLNSFSERLIMTVIIKYHDIVKIV